MIPTGWLAIIALICLAAGILAWRRSGPVEGPDRLDGWRGQDPRTWTETDADRYPWKEGER